MRGVGGGRPKNEDEWRFVTEHHKIDILRHRTPVTHPPIAEVTTPNLPGRWRRWWLCPSCARRTRTLFHVEGRWQCRLCADLVYPTTRLDEKTRRLRRIAAIRRELGASNSLVGLSTAETLGEIIEAAMTEVFWLLEDVPRRPPGMWGTRYLRLVRELHREQDRVCALLRAEFSALAANTRALRYQAERL